MEENECMSESSLLDDISRVLKKVLFVGFLHSSSPLHVQKSISIPDDISKDDEITDFEKIEARLIDMMSCVRSVDGITACLDMIRFVECNGSSQNFFDRETQISPHVTRLKQFHESLFMLSAFDGMSEPVTSAEDGIFENKVYPSKLSAGNLLIRFTHHFHAQLNLFLEAICESSLLATDAERDLVCVAEIRKRALVIYEQIFSFDHSVHFQSQSQMHSTSRTKTSYSTEFTSLEAYVKNELPIRSRLFRLTELTQLFMENTDELENTECEKLSYRAEALSWLRLHRRYQSKVSQPSSLLSEISLSKPTLTQEPPSPDLAITEVAEDAGLGLFSPYTDVSNSAEFNSRHYARRADSYLQANSGIFPLFVNPENNLPFSFFCEFFEKVSDSSIKSESTLVLPAFSNATEGLGIRLDYYSRQLLVGCRPESLSLRVEVLLDHVLTLRVQPARSCLFEAAATLLLALVQQMIQDTMVAPSSGNLKTLSGLLGLDTPLALPLQLFLILLAMLEAAPTEDATLLVLLQPTQASIHRLLREQLLKLQESHSDLLAKRVKVEQRNLQRRRELEPLCDVDGDVVERSSARLPPAMEKEESPDLTAEQWLIQSIEELLIASTDCSLSVDPEQPYAHVTESKTHERNLNFIRFEDIVEYLLQPALHLVQHTSNLHSAFAFVSIIVETLTSVTEILEKRTYGLAGLTKVIGKWTEVLLKLRTLLVLEARRGSHKIKTHILSEPLSIYRVEAVKFSLSNKTRSTYRRPDKRRTSTPNYATQPCAVDLCLAEDILCFASSGHAAAELEHKCSEKVDAYLTHMKQAKLSAVNGDERRRSFKSPLVAWKCNPAHRWRDLLALAEADMCESSSRGSSSKRPLLLLFPHHIDACTMAVYRTLISIERWLRCFKNMDLFSQAVSHLQTVPMKSFSKKVESDEKTSDNDEEHEPHGGVSVATRSLLACFLYVRVVYPVLELLLAMDERGPDHPHIVATLHPSLQEIVTSLTLPEVQLPFLRGALEVIECIQQMECDDSIDISIRYDQDSASTWPAPSNVFVPLLLGLYAPLAVDIKHHPPSLQRHRLVVNVLFLRLACHMRATKLPSLLQSTPVKTPAIDTEYLLTGYTLTEIADSLFDASPETLVGQLDELQLKYMAPVNGDSSKAKEFLAGCLRRVPVAKALRPTASLAASPSPASTRSTDHASNIAIQVKRVVYETSSMLGIDQRTLRVLHIGVLLEKNSADADHAADELIIQGKVGNDVLQAVAAAMRRRLGHCIVHIESVPTCANVVASMDPAYLNWARTAAGPPDMQVVSKILHKLQPPVAFDIPSTEHLIQRVISLVSKQREGCIHHTMRLHTMPPEEAMQMEKLVLQDMNGLLSLCALLSHIQTI